MKSLWLLLALSCAFSLQACSLTGRSGSPESTRTFLKEEMGRRGL
ncbi:hypothetical protein BY998_102207 [Methylobacterium sp. B4]|nr:hypothetical protein BY998_102207 [Methylobacterium sp. B4]